MQKTEIILLDLFSGIGGFSLGLTQAGFNITTHYYSEIDKHAIAIYKYQFKNSIYAGDITTLDRGSITRPNIITFGSPCQDFSVAGKRAGLEGQRSSLIGQAIRLITELKPDLFIWENVKGVFSSNNGEDFWAVIQAFTNIGSYRLEWQLLNTAWFLPQNRERIYLIGHLAERGGQLVFPIGENVDIFNQSWGKEGNSIQSQHLSKCLTSTAEQKGNLMSNYVCVAQRGREEKCLSPKRTDYGKKIRKQYENGEIKEQRKNIQQLEPRDDGVTNTLTGVQKDNLIINIGNLKGDGSLSRDYSEQDRVYDADQSKLGATINATSNSKYLKDSKIRRLTEVECERLQGFPDDWTEYGNYDGEVKKVAKTQRYKMLGNAVTVKVVEEIGRRLLCSSE